MIEIILQSGATLPVPYGEMNRNGAFHVWFGSLDLHRAPDLTLAPGSWIAYRITDSPDTTVRQQRD